MTTRVGASDRRVVGVVVPPDPADFSPLARYDERDCPHVVAPVTAVRNGQSPLDAAAAAVRRTVGVGQLAYVCYLGQCREALSGVPCYLFHASGDVEAEATWITLDEALASCDQDVAPMLERAHEAVTWRRDSAQAYSRVLSALVEQCSRQAAEILGGMPAAGLGLCGSAARGDFVDGWSDVDLVAWGVSPTSATARRLDDLAAALAETFLVRTSLDLADLDGEDAVDHDPLFTAKLQGLFLRSSTDLAVLAGAKPPEPTVLRLTDDLDEGIDRLRRFAVRHLASEATSPGERADRARRVLSVACHAARSVSTALDPASALGLRAVASHLEDHWPDNRLAAVLLGYVDFRRSSARQVHDAEVLAALVPDALLELTRLHAVGGGDPQKAQS
jgi:hypothetical protein